MRNKPIIYGLMVGLLGSCAALEAIKVAKVEIPKGGSGEIAIPKIDIPANISQGSALFSEKNIVEILKFLKEKGYASYISAEDLKHPKLKVRKLGGGGAHTAGLFGIKLASDKSTKKYTYIIKLLPHTKAVESEIKNLGRLKSRLSHYDMKNHGTENSFSISLPEESLYLQHQNKVYPISIIEFAPGELFSKILSGYDGTPAYKEKIRKSLAAIGRALGEFHFETRLKRDKVGEDLLYLTRTHFDFHGENILVDPSREFQVTFIDNEGVEHSIDKGALPEHDFMYFYGMHTVGSRFSNPVKKITLEVWHKEMMPAFFEGYINVHPENQNGQNYREFAKEYLAQFLIHNVSEKNLEGYNKFLENMQPVSGWNYHVKKSGGESKLKEMLRSYGKHIIGDKK